MDAGSYAVLCGGKKIDSSQEPYPSTVFFLRKQSSPSCLHFSFPEFFSTSQLAGQESSWSFQMKEIFLRV